MKKSILFLIGIITVCSCQRNDPDGNLIDQFGEICKRKTDVLPPSGFEVNTIGGIDFNGSVQEFQFVNAQIGFAMLNNNVGGYVEVFKTTDGGLTWTDLNIGIKHYPINMVFKDENFGIITVHDVSGCPPPNCQNKCVILKTVNGGLDWEEVTLDAFKGILYHPKFDKDGNLYANINLDAHSLLLKSKDNGINWDTLFSTAELVVSLRTYSLEIFQDKIFISAEGGRIIVVDTQGTYIKTIEVNDPNIWDVSILDENNLVVVTSKGVLKSKNGGETWESIYDSGARMIGFDSVDKGLMLLEKSSCPTDVYQVNDLIAATSNGGLNWKEAAETTTNLRANYVNSQKMGDGIWYFMAGNKLFEIKAK